MKGNNKMPAKAEDLKKEEQNPPADAQSENMVPQSRLNDYAEQNRQQAAKLDEQAATLAEMQSKLEALQEAKLIEDNNQTELAKTRLEKINELEPKAKEYEALNTRLDSMLETVKEGLSPQFVEAIPKKYSNADQLDWIEANRATFEDPEPPDIDAGKKGTKQVPSTLTPAQKAAADRFGMSYEDYAKNL